MIPVLVFDLLFARALPRVFQPDVFSRDIPLWMSGPEHVFRVLLFVLVLLMPLRRPGTSSRALGFAIYTVGLGLYFVSWAALIFHPDDAWSRSAWGFMAPSWTPIFWMTGIVLLGERRLFVPIHFYRPWMFPAVCGLFLLFHNAHAALVFSRQP